MTPQPPQPNPIPTRATLPGARELGDDPEEGELEGEEDETAAAPAKGKGPAPKVGGFVLVHCLVAPGPQPAALVATVKKVHKDGRLDLEVARDATRLRNLNLERVPQGEGGQTLSNGPWWEHPPKEPPAAAPKGAPKK